MPPSRGWIEPNRERAERILLEDGTIMSIQEARATGVVTESPFSCNKSAAPEPSSRSAGPDRRIDPQLQNPRPVFTVSVSATGVWETAADVARLHSNFEDALSPVGVSEPAEEVEPGGEAGAGEVWDDARFVALSHMQDMAPAAAGANRHAAQVVASRQKAAHKKKGGRNRHVEESEGGSTREQDVAESEGAATCSEHDGSDGGDHEGANRRASTTHESQGENPEEVEAEQLLSQEGERGEEDEEGSAGTEEEGSDCEGSSADEDAHRQPARGGAAAAHGRKDSEEQSSERSAEAEMRIIKSQRQEYECMICLQVL